MATLPSMQDRGNISLRSTIIKINKFRRKNTCDMKELKDSLTNAYKVFEKKDYTLL